MGFSLSLSSDRKVGRVRNCVRESEEFFDQVYMLQEQKCLYMGHADITVSPLKFFLMAVESVKFGLLQCCRDMHTLDSCC